MIALPPAEPLVLQLTYQDGRPIAFTCSQLDYDKVLALQVLASAQVALLQALAQERGKQGPQIVRPFG